MNNQSLLLPDALGILDQQLRQPLDLGAVLHALRTLQRLNLSQVDLQIHLERASAVNEVRDRDPLVEANCRVALDIVLGYAGDLSLPWDAAEMARLLLPRCLDEDVLRTAVDSALVPNDLLPERRIQVSAEDLKVELEPHLSRVLEGEELVAQPADFFRVPKGMFASRPAALLAPADRICYEALADLVAPLLSDIAPPTVVWPRSRQHGLHTEFARRPLEWSHAYVVKADIESFYEHVDHAKLGVVLASVLQTNSIFTRATEALLDAVMSSTTGLPQGPPASEIFASCYLLFVDRQLERAGIEYVRYADDYRIGADSFLDARHKVGRLEGWLNELGLSLNPRKTYVWRADTYRARISGGAGPHIDALRKRIAQMAEEQLRERIAAGEDLQEELEQIGLGGEVVEDAIYPGGMSLDEMIDELRDALTPTLAQCYAALLKEEASKLQNNDHPSDEQGAQTELQAALLHLAGANHWVDWQAVSTILLWYPALAPASAAYLKRLSRQYPAEVREALSEWLAPDFATDWVQAWGCSVLENAPDIADTGLSGRLRSLAFSRDAGALSRAGAMTALAASGQLSQDVYDTVMHDCTAAMAADLYLHSVANPGGYTGIQVNEGRLALASNTEPTDETERS